MSKSEPTLKQITFDKSAAQFVIDLLGVDKCASCGKTITAENYGGSIMLDDGPGHYHDNLVCLMDLMKEMGNERTNLSPTGD